MQRLLITVLCVAAAAHARSSGNVPEACDSLAPGHSGSAQPSSTSPYTLEVAAAEAAPGETVDVTLKTAGDGFKGFIVQAKEDGGALMGEITDLGGLSQQLPCSGGVDTATASHTGPGVKTEAVLKYKVPGDAAAGTKIKFEFSVVKDYGTFWVKEQANQMLTVTAAAADNSESGGDDDDAKTEPEPEDEKEPEPEAENKSGFHSSYSGCLETKGCFGLPADCVGSGNCDAMVSYSISGDTATMLLHGKSSAGYTALGLSSDDKMGSDLVIACVKGEKVGVFWNEGKSNKKGVTGVEAKDVVGKSENGINTCSFTLPATLQATPPGASAAQEFALGTEKYHLLVATGPVSGEELGYHSAKVASGEKVDLLATSGVAGGGASAYVRAHGCLMVLAWLLCAAVGMMFAR